MYIWHGIVNKCKAMHLMSHRRNFNWNERRFWNVSCSIISQFNLCIIISMIDENFDFTCNGIISISLISILSNRIIKVARLIIFSFNSNPIKFKFKQWLKPNHCCLILWHGDSRALFCVIYEYLKILIVWQMAINNNTHYRIPIKFHLKLQRD